MDAQTNVITYGDFVVDPASVPGGAVLSGNALAMFRRGLVHYLGNEVSAKVSGWKDERTAAGNPANDAEVAAVRADYMRLAYETLMTGVVGAGAARGPRGSSYETELRKTIVATIVTRLKSIGISKPKSATDLIKFANGDEFTLDQLVKRFESREADMAGAKKETDARIAAEKRKAEKALKEAEAQAIGGKIGAEALGL